MKKLETLCIVDRFYKADTGLNFWFATLLAHHIIPIGIEDIKKQVSLAVRACYPL